VTTATEPTTAEIADVLDKARAHIVAYGFCKKYLYNTNQARNGTPLERCEVDLVGAINYAVHGTPRHVGGDPLTWAAEQALTARIDAPSITTWCDYKGNGKDQAIRLLRDTAAQLRRGATS
jgi:hypothetical protein